MIKKVKQMAEHYWMDHKIAVAIFAILVVSLIIKQDFMYYGDSQDELLLYRYSNNTVMSDSFYRSCVSQHYTK